MIARDAKEAVLAVPAVSATTPDLCAVSTLVIGNKSQVRRFEEVRRVRVTEST